MRRKLAHCRQPCPPSPFEVTFKPNPHEQEQLQLLRQLAAELEFRREREQVLLEQVAQLESLQARLQERVGPSSRASSRARSSSAHSITPKSRLNV